MRIEVTQLLGVALLGAAALLPLKKNAPEFAFLGEVALLFVLFIFAAGYFSDVVEAVKEISSLGDAGLRYAGLLLKAGGVTIAGSLASDMCRDSGETAPANLIDLIVKVIVLSLALPIIKVLMELSLQLLK